MKRTLSDLVENLKDYQVFGDIRVEISGITDDSRKVKKGNLFVAIRGLTSDAHKYIPQVINQGARVVVGEIAPQKEWLDKVVYLQVKDSREFFSYLASSWYGYPARKLKIIGVTGTDGKTTTANIIYWILNRAGFKVGLVSTVSAKIGDQEYDTGFHVTNPEPMALQKFLAEMVKRGLEYAVLEVTSHGLDQSRVAGIPFEISALTNITHEHLDYHKTLANYIKAKSKLFNQSKIAVLNETDKNFTKVKKLINKKTKILTYNSDLFQGKLKAVVWERFKENYNRLNAAAAFVVCRELGLRQNRIAAGISSFPGVVGRMEEIKNSKGIRIIVDFAHTPNALLQLLQTLNKQRENNSKIIVVFGCAGERDKGKRPLMGEIAVKYADFSIFTAEDPRGEDLNKIIDQIIVGAKEVKIKSHKYYIKQDRTKAIEFAINELAKKGDIVAICGKGHEKSMNFAGVEQPWSDQEAVQKILSTDRKRIHFMGIGGSGISGVALIASEMGYKISGCDLQVATPYIEKLKKSKIQIIEGHSQEHLKDTDVLCVTPAAFFQNSIHPEIAEGKKRKIIMTWQKFLGEYLHKDHSVVCIAGTHGKSTTTAMAGLLFEKAKLDPSAMVGATLFEWGANERVGRGKYFLTEADEFYDNFLNYNPEIIILNNIEFDHPDYFKDEKMLFESFEKFIGRLQGRKILIFNQDSVGIKKLLGMLGDPLLKSIDLIGYTVSDTPLIKTPKSIRATQIEFLPESTHFQIKIQGTTATGNYVLKIPGLYNVSNALGVIALGTVVGIKNKIISQTLSSFKGISRRLEKIGETKGVVVYDDYAHHPTAIKETLTAVSQRHPGARIWAVVEPHTFSRTKALLSLYQDVFVLATKVIITPIFRSRDTSDLGISGESIVKVARHPSIKYIDNFDEIVKEVTTGVAKGDVVVVMGAGASYKLARDIYGNI